MRYALTFASSIALYAGLSQAANTTVTVGTKVSSGCSFDTYTVTAAADFDTLAACSTLVGDVVIAGDIQVANMPGVEAIAGSLIINDNQNLTQFTADSLAAVTEKFTIHDSTELSALVLPSLTAVGYVDFISVPTLSSMGLSSVITQADNVVISNTGLSELTGIDVTKVGIFDINNNRYLHTIATGLISASDYLSISANGAGSGNSLTASFPELLWARNATFRDLDEVALPKLEYVNGSLSFTNTSVKKIDLIVDTLGGSLSFIANDELTSITMDNLTSIGGGFVIANNSALEKIDGFDNLETVGGAIEFAGSFSNATLPSLKAVSGGVSIESDGDDFSCDEFNAMQKKGVVRGNSYQCSGGESSTSVSLTASDEEYSSTATSSSGSSSSASTTEEHDGAMAPAVGGSVVMGALAAFAFNLF